MSSAEWKVMLAAQKDLMQVVDSDAEIVKIAQSLPAAVGFVDVRFVDGSINVVCVDGKLPMESGYLPHWLGDRRIL